MTKELGGSGEGQKARLPPLWYYYSEAPMMDTTLGYLFIPLDYCVLRRTGLGLRVSAHDFLPSSTCIGIVLLSPLVLGIVITLCLGYSAYSVFELLRIAIVRPKKPGPIPGT